MISRQFIAGVGWKGSPARDLPEEYPFSIPAIRSMTKLDLHPAVTFLIGENGSGKSTLLEAIAVACGYNAEGGSRNFNFASRPTHSSLHEHLRISRGIERPRDGFFLRAETFYNVATEVENLGAPGYGDKSLHLQSHGESFLALMMNRFGPGGLYLLDEPEAALSPSRQLAVLSLIHRLTQEGSQFIIATHSPILMAYPSAWIYQFDPGGIARVPYEETEHFTVTRDFITNRERMLKVLLENG